MQECSTLDTSVFSVEVKTGGRSYFIRGLGVKELLVVRHSGCTMNMAGLLGFVFP